MRGSDCQTPQVNSTACLRKVVTIKAPSISSCVMMLYSTFLFLSSNTITRLLSQFPNGTCLVHQCSSNKAGHKYTPNPQMSTSYLRIADISRELVNIFYTPTKSKLPTIYTITSKFVDVTWKQVFREFWGKKKNLSWWKVWWKRRGKKKKKTCMAGWSLFPEREFCICYTHFLHMDTKECTETRPVLSPPDALNRGAFQ